MSTNCQFFHCIFCKFDIEINSDKVILPHCSKRKKKTNSKFTSRISPISRGSRNRTHVNGFGDRCSTAELCPFIQFYVTLNLADEGYYSIALLYNASVFLTFFHKIFCFFIRSVYPYWQPFSTGPVLHIYAQFSPYVRASHT